MNNSLAYTLEIVEISILPLLTAITVGLNVSCAYIFSRNEFKKNYIYKYLTCNSTIDAIILSILVLTPFSNCKLSTIFIDDYLLKSYQLYFGFYATRVFGMISAFINLKISFDRCLFLKRRNNILVKKKLNFKLNLTVFTVLSIIFFIPQIYFTEIQEAQSNTTNTTGYYVLALKKSSNDTQTLAQLTLFVVHFAPFFINLILMIGFSVFLVYQMTRNIQRRHRLMECHHNTKGQHLNLSYNKSTSTVVSSSVSHKNSYNQERNRTVFVQQRQFELCVRQKRIRVMEKRVTLIVIWMSVLFILTQILSASSTILIIVFSSDSLNYQFCTIFAHLIVLICLSSNTFIYYNLDKTFAFYFRTLVGIRINWFRN